MEWALPWTRHSVDAEYELYGADRMARVHNSGIAARDAIIRTLTAENAALTEKLLVANRAIDSLEDDLGIAQCDYHDPIPS